MAEITIEKPTTLWLFNIAVENDPCKDDVPIKMVSFHGYVKEQKGN